jgi:hypothetical protein
VASGGVPNDDDLAIMTGDLIRKVLDCSPHISNHRIRITGDAPVFD